MKFKIVKQQRTPMKQKTGSSKNNSIKFIKF